MDIEYFNVTPAGVNWPRLAFPFPSIDSKFFKSHASGARMQRVKNFLFSLGYRNNVDFKFDLTYYDDKIVVFAGEELYANAALVILQWDPR